MDVTCTCGTVFQARSAKARYCSDRCRKRRSPRADAALDVPTQPGELEVAVRTELARVERLKSWRGAAAVRLARECDTATGSQVSSLIKQLEAAMAAALDGVPPVPDFVDEMAERRQAKRA